MTWNEVIQPALQNPKLLQLKAYIRAERAKVNIYPKADEMFTAFNLCPYEKTRVVILGQDPYHTFGTAHGLAFSTLQDKRPPSLEVIFKEIYQDLNIQYFHNVTFDEFFPTNNLTKWTQNGFLLLNTALTVEEGKPNSHQNMGWEILIAAVMDALNKHHKQIIFLLWGKNAQEYERLIDRKKHSIFKAAHPAAELYKNGEGGFLGCRHFSIVRDVLPMIYNEEPDKFLRLDAAFDKEKAKQIAKEHFKLHTKELIDFIDNELIIAAPLNKDAYYSHLRKFEKSLSTNYQTNE